MISRMSSGSSRAESVVEPTRSTKHHGEMPAFGRGVGKKRRRRLDRRFGLFRRYGSHFRDRFDEALAVPEWNAELLQISIGQIGQDFRVNCMLAEKGEVLAKPKVPQPVADIHGRAPHGLMG